MSDQGKSLRDLMDQKVEIPMMNGKKAVIGSMNLEALCWAAEKFGSIEGFQSLFEDKEKAFRQLPAITEFVFQILENQKDFEDVKDFRKNFSFHAIGSLAEAIGSIISGSMPDVSGETQGEGQASEGK